MKKLLIACVAAGMSIGSCLSDDSAQPSNDSNKTLTSTQTCVQTWCKTDGQESLTKSDRRKWFINGVTAGKLLKAFVDLYRNKQPRLTTLTKLAIGFALTPSEIGTTPFEDPDSDLYKALLAIKGLEKKQRETLEVTKEAAKKYSSAKKDYEEAKLNYYATQVIEQLADDFLYAVKSNDRVDLASVQLDVVEAVYAHCVDQLKTAREQHDKTFKAMLNSRRTLNEQRRAIEELTNAYNERLKQLNPKPVAPPGFFTGNRVSELRRQVAQLLQPVDLETDTEDKLRAIQKQGREQLEALYRERYPSFGPTEVDGVEPPAIGGFGTNDLTPLLFEYFETLDRVAEEEGIRLQQPENGDENAECGCAEAGAIQQQEHARNVAEVYQDVLVVTASQVDIANKTMRTLAKIRVQPSKRLAALNQEQLLGIYMHMTPAKRKQWIDDGIITFEDERNEKGELVRSAKEIKQDHLEWTKQETVATNIDTWAQGLSGAVQGLRALGVKGKTIDRLAKISGKIAGVAKVAKKLAGVSQLTTGDWMGAVASVAGMLLNNGPDPDQVRHEQVMKALGQIAKGIDDIKKKLNEIDKRLHRMEKRQITQHIEVLQKLWLLGLGIDANWTVQYQRLLDDYFGEPESFIEGQLASNTLKAKQRAWQTEGSFKDAEKRLNLMCQSLRKRGQIHAILLVAKSFEEFGEFETEFYGPSLSRLKAHSDLNSALTIPSLSVRSLEEKLHRLGNGKVEVPAIGRWNDMLNPHNLQAVCELALMFNLLRPWADENNGNAKMLVPNQLFDEKRAVLLAERNKVSIDTLQELLRLVNMSIAQQQMLTGDVLLTEFYESVCSRLATGEQANQAKGERETASTIRELRRLYKYKVQHGNPNVETTGQILVRNFMMYFCCKRAHAAGFDAASWSLALSSDSPRLLQDALRYKEGWRCEFRLEKRPDSDRWFLVLEEENADEQANPDLKEWEKSGLAIPLPTASQFAAGSLEPTSTLPGLLLLRSKMMAQIAEFQFVNSLSHEDQVRLAQYLLSTH